MMMLSLVSRWFRGELQTGRKNRPLLPTRWPPFQLSVGVLRHRCPPASWSPVSPLPTAHIRFGAATGSDGQIYAIGGYNDTVGTNNTVEAYNLGTKSWSAVASMPTTRASLAAAEGSDGRIYAIGGIDKLGDW